MWRSIKGEENMSFEVCKVIKDFPTYEISNLGNVYSLYHGYEKRKQKRLCKPQLNGIEYYSVRLYDRKKKTKNKYLIHRLVAQAFLENPENKLQVNHKDSNKLNNKLSNLKWCTNGENQIHARNHGVKNHKLTMDIADKIREEYKQGNTTHAKLGKKYGVSSTQIHNIIHNIGWKV